MPNIPGLPADVYFGEPSDVNPSLTELPTTQDEDQDDDPAMSDEERKRLIGVLGFDPSALDEGNGDAKDNAGK